jgi:hypothetical protein
MTNKILRSVAVLALYGGLSQVVYCSTSGGLSSSIDSEGFTAEQKRAMQQTAMAKLGDKEPLLSSTILDEKKPTTINPKVETGKLKISADGEAKGIAVIVKPGNNSDITTGDIDIQAKDRARAAGVVVGDIDF